MENCSNGAPEQTVSFDSYTKELLNELCSPLLEGLKPDDNELKDVTNLLEIAKGKELTGPIVELFAKLIK